MRFRVTGVPTALACSCQVSRATYALYQTWQPAVLPQTPGSHIIRGAGNIVVPLPRLVQHPCFFLASPCVRGGGFVRETRE